jgi:hypothetical protein
MKRIKLSGWIAFIGLVLGTTACLFEPEYSQKEVDAKMKQTLNDRLLEYRQLSLRNCREELLKEAIKRADSLLVLDTYFKRDTLTLPPKPQRPGDPIPEVKSKTADTLRLRPFFERGKRKFKRDTILKQ